MGIQGLLPFLKEASESIHIRKYKGYTVGVDTYCWIHRGAIACATQLAKGDPADHYVRYCVKYVNMLRSLDIKPVLVFDGRNLPAKASVEESRRERRETNNRKGRQFLREGKASEARDCFVKSINVTPEMALYFMKAVRSLGVDCIVAPYEADAQLAYLQKNGIVQAVITEDSDLIAFGCKKVIVKLDLAGNCLEVDSSNLNQAMKIGEKFTPDKFRYMCIVAGCDYLPSLPGIGLGKARKLFHLTTNPDISQVIKRMTTTLKMKSTVTPEYLEGFQQANNTFLYQLAFDPREKKLVPLTPYPPEVEPSLLTYAGRYIAEDKAYQMALGNLNFNTMNRMCDFDPETRKPYDRTKTPRHMLSIWHEHYQPGPGLGCKLDPVPIEREPTKGKEITVEVKQRMIQRKRQREDVEEPTPLSDVDLSTIYINQGHRGETQLAETREIIPETPEKQKSEEVKPARRNRFATKLLARKRTDILKSGEVVTSRFFQSKKPDTQDQKQAVVKTEQETEEEDEKENQLNTSGLLEGIANIEQQQEKQFKPDNDSEDTLEGNQGSETEPQTDDCVIILEKDTHVSKSLNALQKFQRSSSAPKIFKQDNRASSSSASRAEVCAAKEYSTSKTSGYSQESQESVIHIASSQDSVISLIDSCSQSSCSSSQRHGTPRPQSAFSWSRKKELQGSSGRSNQTKQSSLSSFAFRPNSNQMRTMRRNSSFTTRAQEGGSQNPTLTRTDSLKTNISLLSQESSSSMFPSSMDMAGINGGDDIDDSQPKVIFTDSQSSSSHSRNTSSVDLTSSQTSPSPSSPTQDSLPSLPSLPLPALPPRGSRGGEGRDREVAEQDGEDSLQREGDAVNEEDPGTKQSRQRMLLSRKRKFSQISKGKSANTISSESSSPDTDALSLDPSSSSQPSSSAPSLQDHMEISILATATASPIRLGAQSDSSKSQQKLAKRNFSRQSERSCADSSKYFSSSKQETLSGRTVEGGVEDAESSHESENTPPRGSQLPVSPSKGTVRSVKLLGDRNYRVPEGVPDDVDSSTKNDASSQNKQSSLLGRCKTVGLSKKRRPSSKQTPTSTPKGQTSLLAFMSKPKPKNEVPSEKGSSLSSDLTPELESSLLSRHEHITSKRSIFN